MSASNFQLCVWIFIGGGIGSVFRFLISQLMNKWLSHPFPIGTLCVNILGSLLIGFFYALSEKSIHIDLRMFLIIGFCGGFTTFSTFSYENLQLLQNGEIWHFIGYALLSILLCIFCVWLGDLIGKAVVNS